jgi:glycosyltransferase involved in cell wall biosynthesis
MRDVEPYPPRDMPDPLVSIVTPSLNQGAFIRQAIASVRGQTYGTVEHIVIDGRSTDGTVAILEEAASNGQVRFVSEPDRGMYDALNKGFAMSTGEVLGYLNCDDVLTPWAIETAVQAFQANPDADVVFGDGLTIDESTGKQRLALIPPFDARVYARVGSLVQPAVFWRRHAFERVGQFDAGLRFVGDLDYWLRLGRTERFFRVDEVLAIERHHDAALSRTSADRMAQETAEVRQRHQVDLGAGSRIAGWLARSRAALWRRYLWLRFLRRLPGGGAAKGSPWAEFIAQGKVHSSTPRVIAMFVPRFGAPFAWDAVVSDRPWSGTQDATPPG